MFYYCRDDQFFSLVILFKYFCFYFTVALKFSVWQNYLKFQRTKFSLCFNFRCPSVSESIIMQNMFKLDTAIKGQHSFSRTRYLYNSSMYTDCSFIVDGIEIKAHKYLLAIHSPRMEKLFFESRLDGPVHVPFSEPVMRQVLRFVYCQEQDIFNADPLDVMEAAFHFQMLDLIELCGTKIIIADLLQMYKLLNMSCCFNCLSLKNKCLDMARQYPSQVLTNDGYLLLTAKALTCLLDEDVIKVNNEIEIISAVKNWISYRKKDAKAYNLRREIHLSGLFNTIRSHGLDDYYDSLKHICEGLFTPLEFNRMMNILQYDQQLNDTVFNQIQRSVEIVNEYNPYTFFVTTYKQTKLELFHWGSNNTARPYFKSISLRTKLKVNGSVASMNSHYKEHIEMKLYLNDIFIAYGKYKGYAAYNDSVTVKLTYLYDALATAYSVQTNNITVLMMFHNRGNYELGPLPITTDFLIPKDSASLSLIKKYVSLPCYNKELFETDMDDNNNFSTKANHAGTAVRCVVIGTFHRLAAMFSSFIRLFQCNDANHFY